MVRFVVAVFLPAGFVAEDAERLEFEHVASGVGGAASLHVLAQQAHAQAGVGRSRRPGARLQRQFLFRRQNRVLTSIKQLIESKSKRSQQVTLAKSRSQLGIGLKTWFHRFRLGCYRCGRTRSSCAYRLIVFGQEEALLQLEDDAVVRLQGLGAFQPQPLQVAAGRRQFAHQARDLNIKRDTFRLESKEENKTLPSRWSFGLNSRSCGTPTGQLVSGQDVTQSGSSVLEGSGRRTLKTRSF